MNFKRRNFLRFSALAAGTAATTGFRRVGSMLPTGTEETIDVATDATPISLMERKERISKAQALLVRNGMQALIVEGGTSLEYFTGASWWTSERTMVAIIPASGEVKYVCPGFEESRFRELISIGHQVTVWQEDESPYQKIVGALQEAGIHSGRIGIEEQIRFFIADGIKKAAPEFEYVSGDPVSIPCRMFKSAAEIALMQKASDITVAAMKAGIAGLKEGMSPDDVSAIISKAHRQLGATPDFALVLFGIASALPHGTTKPQRLQKGDIVLMDCGCRVEGYCSDITRTIVFGKEPTKRQLDIWSLEQQAQASAFAQAKNGVACGAIDAAARKVITDAGFGPGYRLPGLPHRTGHGIGMDGHEWGNMVKDNPLLLQPGMCFSIEPTISIPGEFGVRMEDCVYMTDAGAHWFSQPAISIDKPFA